MKRVKIDLISAHLLLHRYIIILRLSHNIVNLSLKLISSILFISSHCFNHYFLEIVEVLLNKLLLNQLPKNVLKILVNCI